MNQSIICAEDIINDNDDNYKPSDNRTHVDRILSYDPIFDMRIRKTLAKRNESSHQSFSDTLIGKAKTKIYAESMKPSFTPVLYFPKENEIGMKKVSDMSFTTVYPQSLIERFKMNDSSVQKIESIKVKHSSPIYFSAKTEQFYFFFDVRLVDDLSLESIKNILPKEIKSFSNKKKRNSLFLGFGSDSIKELKNLVLDKESFYHKFLSDYTLMFTKFNEGKDVILVKYYAENKSLDSASNVAENLFKVNLNDTKDLHNLYMGLSFLRGVKVGDQVYLYDKNGNINKHNSIFINPKHNDINNYLNLFKDRKELSLSEQIDSSKIILNIIDYTEDNWNYLINLKEKLNSILNSINELFLSSKTELGLSDKSFKDLDNSNIKLLN